MSEILPTLLGGTAGLAILIVFVALAVCWLFLPFVLVNSIGKLRKEMEAMHDTQRNSGVYLATIARHLEQQNGQLGAIHAANVVSNKLLSGAVVREE
jgi:hypothetical protein